MGRKVRFCLKGINALRGMETLPRAEDIPFCSRLKGINALMGMETDKEP